MVLTESRRENFDLKLTHALKLCGISVKQKSDQKSSKVTNTTRLQCHVPQFYEIFLF
jgi:hypothetical protein